MKNTKTTLNNSRYGNIIIYFSCFSFITLLIINVLTFIILFFLGNNDITIFPIPPAGAKPEFISFLIHNFLISLTLGIGISGFLITVTAKPLRTLISAINELANGNFNVRIKKTHDSIFGSLNESFNKMAEELNSVEMLRSNFINDFSHEFKTPIVSIRGFSKLLQSDNLTEEERQEYLSIIISECERLTSLSTNILNLSKLENQKIVTDMESFYLSEQIRCSILLLESKWRNKNIEFDLAMENFTYTGNKEMLQEVWINLIDNAIKFSPDGGTIIIILKRDVEQNEVCFKIKDYGCGISEKSRSHIFQKFYQADQSHTTEGNGLGLAIAARVIELHDGTLTLAEPEVPNETGTTFEIRLPIV